MNRRQFTRRAMFGLFGGAAAVTATEVKPQGRFPHKDHFTHKTSLGFYDLAWSGWHQLFNQSICCGNWFAVAVQPSVAPWASGYDAKRPYGFYSSTTGTAGPFLSPSYVVDTTLITGHPLISIYSTPKQKADSRLEAFDRILKMIADWNEESAKEIIKPPMHYYTVDDAKRLADLPMKPGSLIPIKEMIAKFNMK